MAGVSLSMLRFFENEMNMVTSIIPLVIFTVTLSLSFHSFFSIKEFGSLVMFLKNKWKPVFLMMFTTYIGFLSLITSDVSVIVTFGNFSAQLVLLSTVFVYFWYKLLESTVVNSKKENVKIRIDKFVEKALSLKLVIFISILSCLAVVYIPNRLDVLTDATKYFPSDSGLREDILDVSKTVAGIPVLEIVFDLPKDIDQETVYLFNDLENKIKSILFKKKIKILSNNTFVKNVNYKYTGINQLPENLISYFTLRSQLPLSLQDSYPTDGHYRMTLLGEPSDVQDFKKDIEQISDILKDQKFKYSFGGLNYTLMLSQETMISVLYKSFLSSALVVFFCAFIYFKKLKIFLSFVLVSLIPILSSFLFMYIFNYSINIATVMTFSIALGLIGDSSFHIIHARVHHPFKGFNEYSNAVLAPVVVSGVLLFLCFGMFTLNNFLPIRQFGGVLAYVIFTGTLLDIYLLPRLLYPSRHHKDEYNKISKVITN
jgi:predicted RND superfamily exporter protein